MEENTQAHTQTHKSSLLGIWNSNRHENAQAPSEEDMRGMAQDEGKSFIQEEHRQQPECKVAFQGRLDGFLPVTLNPTHKHTNTQNLPPPSVLLFFFCLLVTSLSAELTV